jgi:hypothetical protein
MSAMPERLEDRAIYLAQGGHTFACAQDVLKKVQPSDGGVEDNR